MTYEDRTGVVLPSKEEKRRRSYCCLRIFHLWEDVEKTDEFSSQKCPEEGQRAMDTS